VLLLLVTVSGCGTGPHDRTIIGPYARLLSASEDLGASTVDRARLTVQLPGPSAAGPLKVWASSHGLDVRWDEGERWAVVSGPPESLGRAFGVSIHDFRHDGERFYAAAQSPLVPSALHNGVAGLGRILGYSPHREAAPPTLPRDVADRGLSPDGVATTYNLAPLSAQGFTGTGQTVAVFAFGNYRQSDLDGFSDRYHLSRFAPDVIGGPLPERISGETTMDLEVVHGLAPGARTVVVNARPTAVGDGTYVKVADLMRTVDREAPGAIWSLSIGWACDKFVTAADLAPVRAAVAAAQAHGTSVLDASGDLAGMDCRDGQEWSASPTADDIGLDSVAALPEVTAVGGTTLSTDDQGHWLAETAWFSSVLTLGSGGGRSSVFSRPAWQMSVSPVWKEPQRLIPDVSAVADTLTGLGIILEGRPVTGGGTSLSAPLWAGLAAVVNQFLLANGGRRLGALNLLLYQIAEGARLPAFHDVDRGANAVVSAGPGYDMVTGLGTPDADNLAHDVLDLQRSLR